MKKAFGYIKYVFFFLIGVGLLWLAFRNQDINEVVEGFKTAKYQYVLWAIIAGLASTYSRALRWNMLIRPFGYEVSSFRSFLAVMTGYLANLALPRMGELTRCVILNQTNDVPVNKLIGTVVTERAIDLLAIFCLVLVVLAFEWERLTTFLGGLESPSASSGDATGQFFAQGFWLVILIAAVLLLVAIVVLISRLGFNLLLYKIKVLVLGFWDGLLSIRKIEKAWKFVLHTFFIWAMYILMTYLCFFAVQTTSHLDLSAAFFVMVVGTFGFIAPVQGGIGAYHWLVQESLVLYNIPRAEGLVFATIVHAAQTIYILIFGGLCLLTFILFFRKKLSHVDLESLEEESAKP